MCRSCRRRHIVAAVAVGDTRGDSHVGRRGSVSGESSASGDTPRVARALQEWDVLGAITLEGHPNDGQSGSHIAYPYVLFDQASQL